MVLKNWISACWHTRQWKYLFGTRWFLYNLSYFSINNRIIQWIYRQLRISKGITNLQAHEREDSDLQMHSSATEGFHDIQHLSMWPPHKPYNFNRLDALMKEIHRHKKKRFKGHILCKMLQGNNSTPIVCACAFMSKYQLKLRNSTGTRYHLGAKPWNYQSSFWCKTLGRLLLPLRAAR